MSEHQNKTHPSNATREKPSLGIIVLLVSVAVNGLLAGLLLSSGPIPTLHKPVPVVRTDVVLQGEPRRILRQLPPQRRRQVMQQALKEIKSTDKRQYRQLTNQITKARRNVFEQASRDTLDIVALEQAMNTLQSANTNLTTASDTLMVHILQNLTREERKTALASIQEQQAQRRRRAERNRQRQNQNRP